MRTSLNEIQQIDDYLFKYAGEADAILFEASLILEPALHEKMMWQQKVYDLITQYSRRQLKTEIKAVHQKLFSTPEHSSFAQKIRAFFSAH